MKLRHVVSAGLAALAVAMTALGNVLSAQDTAGTIPAGSFESRADLEAQARIAEGQHRTSEAWLLRNRLERGDFQEGDRIVVYLHSSAAAQPMETLTVRAGKMLQLRLMDELSLEGVLRSELNQRLVKHLSTYLQDSEVRATPLLRIGVMGSVGHQGYYYTSADVLLNDLIMRAGGPGSDADLNNVRIRRGPTVIWDGQDTRTALTDGMSLDRLHLRAGDEVVVPARRNLPWGQIISIAIGVISLGLALRR